MQKKYLTGYSFISLSVALQQWQANEKAKDDGLEPSSIECKGSSSEGAEASTTSEPQSSSPVSELSDAIREEKLKISEKTD